jgi:hypothetical protein
MRLGHSIQEMRAIARGRSGTCLSERYETLREKLTWSCSQGHVWTAIAGNVLNGSWCPFCACRVKGTLEQMQQIAASRGGECLSKEYVRQSEPMSWRCSHGHVWTAPAAAIKCGKWCSRCAAVARHTIGIMRELANARGGSCESIEYINADSPLIWKCANGHIWRTTAASVRSGSWCAVCARNQRLELNEIQRFAALRRGKCLSPVYINNHTPLIWQCEQGHRWKAAPQNVCRAGPRKGTWCPTCAEHNRQFQQRLTLDDIQTIARGHGGRCLSEEYLGSKVKLVWQCEKGHCWKAYVSPVRRGSWCPLCAGNQRLTLEHFQQLAAQHGGKCLSEEYVNKETPLWFECKAGHRWRTRPAQIRKGAWCGQCAQIARRNPYKRVKPDQGRSTKELSPVR